MKEELFELAKKHGYNVKNVRVLGNPLFTSKESQAEDLVQELALLQNWLRKKHRIKIGINFYMSGNQSYEIWKWETNKLISTTGKWVYTFSSEPISDTQDILLLALSESLKLLEK